MNLQNNNTEHTKEIILNRKFYSKDCISKTADSFKDICRIKIKKQQDSFVITIKCNEHIPDIDKEFSNRCLSLMKQ